MPKFIVFISLVFICGLNISAQEVKNTVGLYTVFSEHTPFWMQSNQFGQYDSEGLGLIGSLNSEFTKNYSESFSFRSELKLVSRFSERSTFYAPFINASIRYRKIYLTAGRFYNSRNQQLEEISTGSLTMSKNAVPIPRVLLSTDFISVPFTQDILQIKGSFGHGVMEDSRFVNRPFLHESSLYGKLGNEKFYLFMGLQRYAFWGGESKDPNVGKLPSSFNDLLRIIFSQEGGKDAPELDQDYKLGDQFGNYDGGLRWTAESITTEIYWQNLFEDKDGLILKNYTDGLFGLAMKLKHTRLVNAVLYEHIYSKDQSGPIGADGTRGGAGGQDNYYNHSVYLTGWSHFSRSVGTPFFTSSPSRAKNKSFFDNNRVVVHHLGVGGNLSSDLSYTLKISTSNNYGLYRERDDAIDNNLEYKFLPPLRQTSWIFDVEYSSERFNNIILLGSVAGDQGELYANSFAIQLGVSFKFSEKLNN